MTTWIFQGNPNRFDMEGYLAFAPERITWLVNQSRKKIQLGDQVFLWRARGNGAYGPAGILAECLTDSPVLEIPEEPSGIRFWRGSFEPGIAHRVWLKIIRVAEKGAILERDTISKVPGLGSVGPIGFGNATNFELNENESRELNRIWHSLIGPRSQERANREFDDQAASLESAPLERLLQEYHRHARAAGPPRRTQAMAIIFERDPYVKAIARVRAAFRCEVPDCPSPSFPSISKEPYCEVHHLIPLAENGEDTIENAVCVCANHHRELHFGKRRKQLAELLRSIRG
jgi:hypothetical protein